HHVAARALYHSRPEDRAFLVPSLFRVEVLAALARRNEPAELLDTVDVLVSGPRFHAVAIDASLVDRAAEVARAARLRAYDAIYAALALDRGAALLTLDLELRSKMSAAFPQVSLVAPAG
ncbi:MAG TPA: PIN domain-containing protein, partial [Thermoanaerobaculia bacterium]